MHVSIMFPFLYFSLSEEGFRRIVYWKDAWGPFLERPGNLTGSESYFEIQVSRKVGCVLTCDEVLFVSLANNFTIQYKTQGKKLFKIDHHQSEKCAYARCSNTTSYVIPVPMEKKVRSSDCTCLFSSGRKRAM